MLYDSYVAKIKKLIHLRDWIIRYRFIIASIILIITAGTTTFLSSVGTISVVENVEENIEYGNDIVFEAKAFLKDIEYEYRLKGTQEWSSEKPKSIGTYEVRAKSTGIFGGTKTTEEFVFNINKKPITLSSKYGYVIYGEDLELKGDFAYNDKAYAVGLTDTLVNLDSIIFNQNFSEIHIYDENYNDVTECYEFEVKESLINVLPKDITISIDDIEKEYDGLELKSDKYSIINGSLSDTDILHLEFNSSITTIGSIKNEPTVRINKANGAEVTALYNITLIPGILTIIPKNIEIITESGEYEYDDLEHYVNKFELATDLTDYIVECIEYDTFIDAGEYKNELKFVIKNKDGIDVSENFKINQTPGTIKINKKDLSLTSKDLEVEYSGKRVEYTIELENYELVSNHKLEAYPVDNNNFVFVDTYENTFDVIITNNNDENVTSNYNITYNYGKLTINKRNIKIVTPSNTFVYNGRERFDDQIEFVSELGLCNEHFYRIVENATITNVGQEENIINIEIYSKNTNVTENYNIEYEYGTLTVEKLQVKVKTNTNLDLVYNDQEQYDDGYTLLLNDFVSGQKVIIEDYKTIKYVGEIDNIYTIKVESNGEDVTYNYDISYEYGKLRVNKRQVKIKTDSFSRIYNDTPLFDEERAILEVENYSIIEGHTYILTDEFNQITEVGSILNVLKIKDILDANGKSVFENYDVIYSDSLYGMLTIEPRPINIKLDSDSKEYDGKELTCKTYSHGKDELINGHEIKLDGFSSIINKGEIPNDVTSARIFKGDIEVTKNYEINIEQGTLTITPRILEVGSKDSSKTYDGYVISNTEYILNSGTLVEGQYLKVIGYTEFKDVDSLKNEFTEFVVEDNYGNKYTDNYEITQTTFGILEITTRDITVLTSSKEFIYNGMEQWAEAPANVVIAGSLADTDSIYVDAYSKFIDVNEEGYLNKTTYIIEHSDGSNVTTNYNISYEYGLIKILKKAITIKPKDIEVVYNGKIQKPEESECVNGTSLCDGHSFGEITYNGDIINVGSTDTEILSVIILDADGNDVTSNYEIEKEKGIITISKRIINISNTVLTYNYDGKYQNVDTSKFNISNKIKGHVYDFNVLTTVYEKNAGTYEFDYELIILDEEGNDVTDNYDFILPEGKLIINKRSINVKTKDIEQIYDGLEHTSFEYDLALTLDIVAGHTVIYNQTNYGKIKNVGEETNELVIDKIEDENGNDVTENYNINYSYGKILVLPREVNILTATDSMVYNDEELYNITFEQTSDMKVVEWQDIIVENYKKIRYVDKINNIFTIKIEENGVNVTYNYVINYEYGTLEILPRDLRLITKSIKTVYTSEFIYANDVEYVDQSELVNGQKLTVTKYKQFKNVGIYPNDEFEIEILNKDNINVVDCYNITYEIIGNIEILIREIEIITRSRVFIYDGNPYSLPELDSYLVSDLNENGIGVNDKYLVTKHKYVTTPGTYNNDFEFTIIDSENNDVSSNYDYKDNIFYGKLTVKNNNDLDKIIVQYYRYEQDYYYEEIAYEKGQLITLYDGSDFSYNGYSLIGWSLEPMSDKVDYELSAVTQLNKNVILYAVWQQGDDPSKETVEIYYYYDINDEEGTLQEVNKNEKVILLDQTTFTKEGYILKGWSSIFDSNIVEYEFNTEYTFDDNYSLYAVWEKEHEHTACPECSLCVDKNCTGTDEEKCPGHEPEPEPEHEHIACPKCSLCVDANCDGTEEEKCQGHEEHEHIACPECSLCVDKNCTGTDEEKCPGHEPEPEPEHEHIACPKCSLCVDANCDGTEEEKCPGHEDHEHIACPECSLCVDKNCTGTDEEKCPGHEPEPEPEHEHIACPECSLCVDKNCTGTDEEKCPGHEPEPEPEHEHIACPKCSLCVDANCDGTEEEKCQGHEEHEHIACPECSLCVDKNCTGTDEEKCPGHEPEPEPEHEHIACPKCSLCVDANCDGTEEEKCPGHEDHEHIACPECSLCVDKNCTGTDEEKCPGHEPEPEPEHEHIACPKCSLCVDANCDGTEEEKCPGHEDHEHIACPECSLCVDKNCTGTDEEKCPGHEPEPEPEHEHIACPKCSLCVDANCDGTEEEKCPGHEDHEHIACPECSLCVDKNCTGTDEEKCPGHEPEPEPEHEHIACPKCSLCVDANCDGTEEEKCPGHEDLITIIYHSNGGTGKISNQQVEKGVDIVLSDGSEMTKTGYKLIGWSTSKNANSAKYLLGSTQVFDKNTTLYAVWVEDADIVKEPITIKYYSNIGDNATKLQEAFKNIECILFGASCFTNDKFELIGWSTESDATTAEYLLNQMVIFDCDMELYGVWKESKQSDDKDINFDYSGNMSSNESGLANSNVIAFSFKSTGNKTIYFRQISFGDYEQSEWKDAPVFNYSAYGFNPITLATKILIENGFELDNISIEIKVDDVIYLLPYFAVNNDTSGTDSLFNDIFIGSYSLEYVEFDILEQNDTIKTTLYKEYEKAYSTFVYKNYLQVPDSIISVIEKHIGLAGIDPNSSTVISDVVNYIKNVGKYEHVKYPNGVDHVEYFLDYANKGICQQFAAAATLMFRALGIPARFTIGFVSQAIANTVVDVSAGNFHAWVEIYIDGLGWVVVDPTGSSEDTPTPEPPTPPTPPEKIILNIKPSDRVKEYDGLILYPYEMSDLNKNGVTRIIEGFDEETKIILQDLLDKGYRYEVVITGEQREVGISECYITSIKIYDESNQDVTSNYEINLYPGTLKVVKQLIIVKFYNINKVYNGLIHKATEMHLYDIVGLPNDCHITYDIAGERCEVGETAITLTNIVILNEFGEDMTSNYDFTYEGVIIVRPRKITVQTQSVTKEYDETPLSSDVYWVSVGTLVNNHEIECSMNSSIINVGSIENSINYTVIYDENGKDVTKNYSISYNFGSLTIKESEEGLSK